MRTKWKKLESRLVGGENKIQNKLKRFLYVTSLNWVFDKLENRHVKNGFSTMGQSPRMCYDVCLRKSHSRESDNLTHFSEILPFIEVSKHEWRWSLRRFTPNPHLISHPVWGEPTIAAETADSLLLSAPAYFCSLSICLWLRSSTLRQRIVSWGCGMMGKYWGMRR